MGRADGWGRALGREVFQKLLTHVEGHADQSTFRISFKGVKRADVSFCSESVVELARRFKGSKGFCLVDVATSDLEENLDAAARRVEQPLMIWDGQKARFLGLPVSPGNQEALAFVLDRAQARAAEFAQTRGISIANASSKMKQLWMSGFLMRRESAADSGGTEFVYQRIA
ncbi:hypothetical protein SB2_17775 [Methylobacterium radiotolerans]|nr:hypothetical protein SB3_27240 [Methylobacterium radiotolerans]KTS46348.1 hypothetical protein SB2_17775 [Methylobacterium radiotolerans]